MSRVEEEGAGRPAAAEERRRVVSLAGRLTVLIAAVVVFYDLALTAARLLPELVAPLGWITDPLPGWVARLIAAGLTLPLAFWIGGRFFEPVQRTISGLSNGIRSFRDRDFSVRLARSTDDELGDLVGLYNEVGQILQEERALIRQRELLLQTALNRSPSAIVLVNPLDRIIYANQEARMLFLGGKKLEGLLFSEIVDACPAEMRQLLEGGVDGIFAVEQAEERETYHLAMRRFSLNRQRHTLLLLRRMTSELNRQEVEIWKKVIRIISHELRNSLAPISSLAHSARLIARDSDVSQRLEPIYGSVRERVEHLTGFLEGYARFARLPAPRPERVEWESWVDQFRGLYPFRLTTPFPRRPGWFDPSQLAQVMINLLKNAAEADGRSDVEPIDVRIDRALDGKLRFEVTDRGGGMSDEVLRQALLPFYSTKQGGSGVGLPLCREIVEAHGGNLRIQSREGIGTSVSFWLPPEPGA